MREKLFNHAKTLLNCEFNTNRAFEIFDATSPYTQKGKEDFLILRYRDKIKEGFGLNIFESCYWAFFIKDKTLKIRVYDDIFSSKNSKQYTLNLENKEDDKEKLQQIVEDLLEKEKIFILNAVRGSIYEPDDNCNLF